MARKKLLTESDVKSKVCTCQICGCKFLDTTGTNNLICPKCIEETVERHKNEIAKQIIPPSTGSNVQPATPFSCSVKLPDRWLTRVPKKGTPEHDDSLLPQLEAQLYAKSLESPWGDLPPTQQKIHEIMGAMKDLLLYKNQKYGDSAINPKKVFYKGDSTNSILIRLDDKLGRVMSNTEEKPRVNDVCDIIGYCTLLLISMGVTSGDIAKFKD